MNPKTIRKLDAINHAFYAVVADDFSETRQRAWAGWQRCLEWLPRVSDRPLEVLDPGCGDRRQDNPGVLAQALHAGPGLVGQGLPVALGAETAPPDRPVPALIGDGSAMYTIQAFWTIAREGLNVPTFIFNNRSYGILTIELDRAGARQVGPDAKAQLDLSEPAIDFVSMAQGMGVPARRVARAEDFSAALKDAFETRGPFLIEAIVPSEYEGLKLKALPHMLNALGSVPSPVAKAIKKKIAP